MSKILYEDPKLQKMDSELKKARYISGHTQESLADSLGMDTDDIINIETIYPKKGKK